MLPSPVLPCLFTNGLSNLEGSKSINWEATDVAVVQMGDDEGVNKHFSRVKVRKGTDLRNVFKVEGDEGLDVRFGGQGGV